MAKNDVVLLDGIIDQRIHDRIPSEQRDEVFEYMVLEQCLKDYDLSHDEIESGWIDGTADGGIDGFYLFVNGHLVDDPVEFLWPRSSAAIEVWLITCKHHATFKQVTLDAIIATFQELFDLRLEVSELQGQYSSDVLACRELFSIAYRRLSIGRPRLGFNVVYASRGDAEDVGQGVAARANQITSALSSLFSSCTANFTFVGAAELVEMHRRAKTFSLDLPFIEHLATERYSYVLLVRLEDYWRFVSDESGTLRRYLFDSNVRDYLGTHGVNSDIASSLADQSAPDFWWLNNGVTILATGATVLGKTVQLQDIQIVNGLQTTETIHRYFQAGGTLSQARAVLVKVVVSSDPQVRDQIIRATNNQSPVESAALRATDKVQRDIEAILEKYDWYYERRKNYYRNIGRPKVRFVTPLFLASAAVSLILRNPAKASKLRSKFMRTREGYESVFSEAVPIEVWPRLVAVFKGIEPELTRVRQPHGRGERFINTWRSLVALIVVARRFGSFDYSVSRIAELDANLAIDRAEFEETWDIIRATQEAFDNRRTGRPSFAKACCEEAAERHGITGVDIVGRRQIASPIVVGPPRPGLELPAAVIDKVDALLPDQPWKQGIHRSVAKELELPPKIVAAAIQSLIADGRRFAQHYGVVYDSAGAVVSYDPDRVDTAPHDRRPGASESGLPTVSPEQA